MAKKRAIYSRTKSVKAVARERVGNPHRLVRSWTKRSATVLNTRGHFIQKSSF